MVECTVCKNAIPRGQRFFKGIRGGRYHIGCGRHVKHKKYCYAR